MLLYHVTPKANKPSIAQGGIDPAYSQGKRQECWFVTHGLLAWAMIHVSKRHKVHIDEVIALELFANPEGFTYRGRGKFTCSSVIPSLLITDCYDVDDVAGSVPFDHVSKTEEH